MYAMTEIRDFDDPSEGEYGGYSEEGLWETLEEMGLSQKGALLDELPRDLSPDLRRELGISDELYRRMHSPDKVERGRASAEYEQIAKRQG
jgi:hypothetical protein